MRDWIFSPYENVAINHMATGLRDDIGKIGSIFELLTSGNYDYIVQLENGDKVKVKETEIKKLPNEIYRLHRCFKQNKKVLYVPTNEIVEVIRADYAYMQAEIEYEDKSMEVVSIHNIREIESDSPKPIKISLIGKMRSGKDTIGDYAVEKYGFTKFAFGDELKRYYHELFGETETKPREGYQWFGQAMRQHEPDIWLRKCFDNIVKAQVKNVIITDTRQPNEVDRCKCEGFITIKVHCDDELRLNRMQEKNDRFNIKDLEHETELHIDTFEYEYLIVNNGSLEDIYKQFDEIMKELVIGVDAI